MSVPRYFQLPKKPGSYARKMHAKERQSLERTLTRH